MSCKYNTDGPDRPSLGHASLGDTSAQALDGLVDEMMEGWHDGGMTAKYGENCRGCYGLVLTGTTLMRSHGELYECQVEPRSLHRDLGDIIADPREQQPRQPGEHLMSSRSESESSLANDYMTDEGSDEGLVSDQGQIGKWRPEARGHSAQHRRTGGSGTHQRSRPTQRRQRRRLL